MKTPRELLLDRHQAARPRLDEIRQQIVGHIATRRRFFALNLWDELILPARRAWLCLAAAWAVILALNVATGGETPFRGIEPGPVSPESVIALQRQERLMAQSIEEDTEPLLPSKTPQQRPRSEAPVEQRIV